MMIFMQDDIAKNVIANVDRIIEAKGIGRTGLAELMGVSPPAVTAMLSKKKPMMTASIAKLATALGVEPCELLCPAKGKKK